MKIKEIDFNDRNKNITGTEIGAIVKHYYKLDFKVYDDFDFILSRKKWSEEELEEYNKLNQDKNAFNFQRGKDFEDAIHSKFSDEFGIKNITDFSNSNKSLCLESERLSATPDFLIKLGNDNLLLVETKASTFSTKSLQAYKYQVALQCLLIHDFNIEKEGHNAIIFFQKDMCEGYNGYELKVEEILKMQKQILDASRKAWIDFENNNFKFISFQEAKKDLKKEQIEVDDIDIIEAYELKEIIKENESQLKEIEARLITNYSNYNYVINDNIKITISKETKTIKDLDFIEMQIKKKEEEMRELLILKEKLEKKEIEPEISIRKRSLIFKKII